MSLNRDRPSNEQLETFLKAFNRLALFEAESRLIRDYGAFSEKDLDEQTQDVISVVNWLKSLRKAPQE